MNEGLTELWDIDGVGRPSGLLRVPGLPADRGMLVTRGGGDRLAYRTRLAYPCLAHSNCQVRTITSCHQTLHPSR
jgi:hypothetical protein